MSTVLFAQSEVDWGGLVFLLIVPAFVGRGLVRCSQKMAAVENAIYRWIIALADAIFGAFQRTE